ncbi:mediator of RNA polymerase II transcription subunit 15 [Drosophila grimshawi]|nr:mediator of RNA polymerase II transcription subunit 15 [Drosophila grimshawi]
MAQAKAESRFNGGTSGLNNEPQQQQLQVNLNAWQPLTGHNNWLILQATAATSMQQRQQQQQPNQQQQQLQQQQQQQQQQAEQQQQRLPVNYYAYNHRYQANEEAAVDIGNYKQVRQNRKVGPSSYVLAISQSIPRLQLSPSDVGQDVRLKPEARKADNFVALTNAADKPVDGPKKSSPPSFTINNYLERFERVMSKVRSFCDTVRELISIEAEGAEEQEMEMEKQLRSDTQSSQLEDSTLTATSKEVQGRHSRMPAVSQSRKLKKLKKKIQKLLLPLLIAYKLKFLTLIPVLIGGLTLLVGTTGLAGFFFALFTAVMSLKSSTGAGHSSKAIVLKKI